MSFNVSFEKNRERIYKIIHNLKIQKYQDELDFIKNDNSQQQRIKKLNSIIKYFKNKNPCKEKKLIYTDKKSKQCLTYTNNMNDFFKELKNMEFRKRWNNLKINNKEIKINEFVDDLNLSKKFSEKLKDILIKKLREKKIHTEKYINYDRNLMKIIEIDTLDINEETEKITILKNIY